MATSPSGEPSRASGSGPSKTKTGPDDFERALRDEEIMGLRVAKRSYSEIAALVGVGKSTVRDSLLRTLASLGASQELVEEYRHTQNAQCDALQSKLWPHLMKPLRDDEGAIVHAP